jgi:hypothetical protein
MGYDTSGIWFNIEHPKGEENIMTDALSRDPIFDPKEQIKY